MGATHIAETNGGARTSEVVLVVDDERLVRWTLRQRLEGEGLTVLEAATGEDALARFREGVDLVLLDHGLPDTLGLDVLRRVRAVDPEPPVILLTAHDYVETAVEAMHLGAYHYVCKPCSLDALAILVRQALQRTRLGREVRRLLAADRAIHGFEGLIGTSAAMVQTKQLLARIAHGPPCTVLLSGESGTGKDLAARSIHDGSERSAGPFMNITCSALPGTLLESELFGHERGAFTDAKEQKRGLLEQAEGGTVFLDEVAEMPPPLQAKVLRFLEEKAFRRIGGREDIRPDVRIVAATHQDLQAAIAAGRFRADLYYRLAVLHAQLPALRERTGDLEVLTSYFVDRFNRAFNKNVRGVSPEALSLIESHSWPGNVRELRNAIERAMLLTDRDVLVPLDFEGLLHEAEQVPFLLPPGGVDIAELERELVVQALERTGSNRTRAARLLGMTRDQIRYRIAKFQLDGVSGA